MDDGIVGHSALHNTVPWDPLHNASGESGGIGAGIRGAFAAKGARYCVVLIVGRRSAGKVGTAFLAGGLGIMLGEKLGAMAGRRAAIMVCCFWSSSSSNDDHLESRIGERDLDEASLRFELLNPALF